MLPPSESWSNGAARATRRPFANWSIATRSGFALIARTVQDRGRADDLAQDVFLRVHRGLTYFEGKRILTWIIASSPMSAPAARAGRGGVAR